MRYSINVLNLGLRFIVLRNIIISKGLINEKVKRKLYKLIRDDDENDIASSIFDGFIIFLIIVTVGYTGGFIGDDEGNTPQRINTAKQSALEDIIDEVLQEGKKLVVIARFVTEINAICK